MARQSTLPTITLEAAKDRWIARRAGSPATERAYLRTYHDFVASLEANGRPTDDIDGIEAMDLEEYLDTLHTESTSKLRFYALRSLFTANRRHLTSHPFDLLETPSWSRPAHRVHILWPDVYRMLDSREIKRDISRKVNNGHRDSAILQILATSGLRRAEVAGLHLSDIEGQRIVIRREVGKGAKERYARMDPAAAAAVDDYIDIVRGRPGSRRGHFAKDYANLFLGLEGPLGPDGVADVVTRRAAQAKLTRRPTAHEFRALWKSTCVDCRISRESIEALAGWLSSGKMFDHYASIDIPRQAAEEYDRLWQRPARTAR